VGERRSVLVNFVYCRPVGHVIEALHYCHGYYRADPSLRIGLALNADTPTELAALCPYVADVYPVTIDVSARLWSMRRQWSNRLTAASSASAGPVSALDRRGAELLFQVLTEREGKASVAIASNESFSGWSKTFTDPRLCAAIVDRLTFNGAIIETGTHSTAWPTPRPPRARSRPPGRATSSRHKTPAKPTHPVGPAQAARVGPNRTALANAGNASCHSPGAGRDVRGGRAE
jgi:hypothetical protein